jgi:hypothetical protein
MELSNQKPFEVPDGGMFTATIIDVVDLPSVQTAFGVKNKVRIVWVLGTNNGVPVADSEGKPFRVIQSYNASMNEKSTLYGIIKQILNAAPPVITTSEQLSQLLIGRSNNLFLVKEADAKNPTKFYANIKGATPLTPGQIAPVAPAGFVRHKDKPQTQAGPNGQPVQTFAQPPAQAAQAAPATNTGTAAPPPNPPTSAPAPQQNVAF